ncbi:MAG: rRNA maturation RNase YbeY [Paracoccaceae bacterium]|nr:rRNA maturation RNase YbeY [Paracoccaceae bacterium]
MSNGFVDLAIADDGWKAALPDLAVLADQGARLALDSAGLQAADWSVCILATSDAEIARLNHEFRGKAGATNVLSWPAFDLVRERPGALPELPPRPDSGLRCPLGDVALALQTIEAEAKNAAIPLKDHVIHLILHGCLHLLGFDHRIDEDAETMERIEGEALARIGVPDPYLRRDPGRSAAP